MPVNSFDNYPMSWRPQLKKDKGSIHKELTDLLRKDINEGVLLPGTKLPPQRELADFLDINVSTVSRAFKECEQEGLLSSAVGSGTFVAYSAISAEAMLPHSGKSGTIEMGSLSPVNLSTNILKKVLDELVNSTELDHLFEYHFPRKNSWHNAVVTDPIYSIQSWNGLKKYFKKLLTTRTTLIRDSRTDDKDIM